jgi:acetyl esterase/lipase
MGGGKWGSLIIAGLSVWLGVHSYFLVSAFNVPMWWYSVTGAARVLEPVLEWAGYPYRDQYLLGSTKYEVEEIHLANQTGALLVFPPNRSQTKLLIWIHGGGFVSFKDPRAYLDFADSLIGLSPDLMIVFPVFRLPPEHPYPIPHEDCVQVVMWLMEQLPEYNIENLDNVFLGGDDSGANLAMAVVNVVKSQSIQFGGLLLVSPMAQIFHFDLPSYQIVNRDPCGVFHMDDLLDSWLYYLLGETSAALREMLLRSHHVSAANRVKHALLDKYNGQSRSIQNVKYRFSQYYNPKAIRTMGEFVTDRLISPLVDQELQDGLHGTEITVFICDRSILRDDANMLVTYFQRAVKSHNVNNEFVSSCFTGSLRYPNMPDSHKIISSLSNRIANRKSS